MRVVIVGSGFGGLGMGIKLDAAGIDYVILEKEAGLGGTWRVNHYPGCACDIPSHLYSFSFEPMPTWERTYGEQWQILEYLEHCADKYRLREKIRFGTEAVGAVFDAERGLWRVTTSAGDVEEGNVLISACGGLSRPSWPDIAGRERFEGPSFHSSEWDHDFEMEGATVAVIGTGASAIQFVPQIAPQVKQLYLFQRTPPWILPKRDFPVSGRAQELFARVPALQRLARWGQYLRQELLGLPLIANHRLLRIGERRALRHLESQVEDPGLRQRLTPSYALGCKRILLSNDYYPALSRSNVELVTDPIECIDERGVVTRDGTHRDVDAIVYGTGFVAAEMPPPFPTRGLEGRDLADLWRDGPQAHLGTAVAGFPNLFFLVGPNSELGHNSMIFIIESQIRYILDAVQVLRSRGLAYLDVKAGAMEAYNRRLHERLDRGIWSTGCSPWYLTRSGKNTTLWPGTTIEYRLRTRAVNLDDFDLVGGD